MTKRESYQNNHKNRITDKISPKGTNKEKHSRTITSAEIQTGVELPAESLTGDRARPVTTLSTDSYNTLQWSCTEHILLKCAHDSPVGES